MMDSSGIAGTVGAKSIGTNPEIAGFVLVDKPAGSTSNRVLQRVRRLFGARKAGHTGSLDPLATGMLPICLGAATKVAQYALSADKHYTVTAQIGVATDTADADGRVIEERALPALNQAAYAAVISQFRGDIAQVPPMYSALKHEGRRLYELARKGIEVERRPRPVRIHSLDLVAADADTFTLQVHCSKGTYIRSLVTDIAAALGTVAHVIALRRDSVDPFAGHRMWTLEALEAQISLGDAARAELLLPVDLVLQHWPRNVLDSSACQRIRHGQKIQISDSAGQGLCRIYGPAEEFVGIGEIVADSTLVPKRIFI